MMTLSPQPIVSAPPATDPANDPTGDHQRPAAFSLIELLVVIAIMALIAAIIFPFMDAMQRSSGQTATEAAVNGAVSAARQIAAVPQTQIEPISSGGGQSFQGAAIIVTNTDQIWLVQHDRTALNSPDEFAYGDVVNREPLELPTNTRIVGIYRNGSGINGLQMITPPFAIRFGPNGELLYGTPSNTEFNVYFDGNYDGMVDTSDSRPDGYDPDDPINQVWRPDVPVGGIDTGRFQLPFERIETALGIAIFEDRSDINLAAPADSSELDTDTVQAILQDARIIFFNRYTGAPIKVNQR